MTPEEADAKQEWKGMAGYTAWKLIEHHADSWDHIEEMMHAWLRANQNYDGIYHCQDGTN